MCTGSVALVHPIEHLRHIARATGADQRVLVGETAVALRAIADDPAGLVVSCRRIVQRHPTAGALWWMCATVLTATDVRTGARRAAQVVADDPTPDTLAASLPAEATVVIIGCPDLIADALRRRGDVVVLAVDATAEGRALGHRLADAGVDAEIVGPAGLAAAVAAADVVLVEALVAGPDAALAASGSCAAVAVASTIGVPAWAVIGRGRTLPAAAFDSVVARTVAVQRPWRADAEVVSFDLTPITVDAAGSGPTVRPRPAECAAPPELLSVGP